MLLCKSCNTRFEDGKTACPSCGRRIFVSLKESTKPGDSGPVGLAAAVSAPASDRDELSGNELDLGEVDVLAEAVEPEAAIELERKRDVLAKPRPRARKLEPEPG